MQTGLANLPDNELPPPKTEGLYKINGFCLRLGRGHPQLHIVKICPKEYRGGKDLFKKKKISEIGKVEYRDLYSHYTSLYTKYIKTTFFSDNKLFFITSFPSVSTGHMLYTTSIGSSATNY